MAVQLTCTSRGITGYPVWGVTVTGKDGFITHYTHDGAPSAEAVLMSAVDYLVARVEMLEHEVWKYEYAGTDE